MRPRANLITGGSDLGIKVPDWVFPQHQHMGARKCTADTIMYKHKLQITSHVAHITSANEGKKSTVLWSLVSFEMGVDISKKNERYIRHAFKVKKK